MSESRSPSPNLNSFGIPVLTEQQKQALFEAPDHGITPVDSLVQFTDISQWLEHGANSNFWMYFRDGTMFDGRRARECFQRFEQLHPDLVEQLFGITEERRRPDGACHIFTEEDQEIFFDAYNKMADLVDVNDSYLNDANPEITVDPHCILQ